MINRIRAAWSVLRGTHKAVPMEASWFVGNTATNVYTVGPLQNYATGSGDVTWVVS